MRARSGVCAAVRTQLASLDSPDELGAPLAGHAAGCLRCQAEMARSRRAHRELTLMAEHPIPAPSGLGASVDLAIDREERAAGEASVPIPVRVAAAAGALAAAAGTIAVIGWMRARSAA